MIAKVISELKSVSRPKILPIGAENIHGRDLIKCSKY